MDTSCKLLSPTQILAICQNIYEGTHKIVILSDWMESPARVNIKQPWQQVISVTLLGYAWCGFKTVYSRGLIPSGSPIVDVLRYVSESSFESIRMGTALARIRESFHTMLSTISNSKPVSTGWLLLTIYIVFLLTITLLLDSTCSYIRHHKSKKAPSKIYATQLSK